MDMRLQREHAAAAAPACCCYGLLQLTAGMFCICCAPRADVIMQGMQLGPAVDPNLSCSKGGQVQPSQG